MNAFDRGTPQMAGYVVETYVNPADRDVLMEMHQLAFGNAKRLG